MFASFTSFLNDVKSTVSAVLDEERAVLEAEQAKIEARGREQREQQQRSERLAVPLWTVWLPGKRALEPDLRAKILRLSADRRTFLTPVPDSAVYAFSFSAAWPFAVQALKLDATLERARFLLVPRRLSEEEFWRRYFYRVDCLRAVAQVDSIVRIPPDEAHARQRLEASRVQAAQPLAMPLAPPSSSGASAAAATGTGTGTATGATSGAAATGCAVDDDDFNDELNRYLNEQLADDDDDDDDNEEPKVNSSPSPSRSRSRSPSRSPPLANGQQGPAEQSLTDVPASAVPAVTAATAPAASIVNASTAPSSAKAVSVTPAIVAAQPAHIPAAAAPVAVPSTVPAAAIPALATPVQQPPASASSAPVSTPAVPAPKPSLTVSAPPHPATASASASAAASTAAAVASLSVLSPLDGSNDDDDLAELESMLAGVGVDGGSGGVRPSSALGNATDEDSELDEAALAELENELDMH